MVSESRQQKKKSRKSSAALGLALLVVLALGAAAAGPASAATNHWHACTDVGAGNGIFDDSSCTQSGGSEAFDWLELEGGSAEGTGMEMATSFSFSVTVGGIKIIITCKSMQDEGEVENPTAGGPGTYSGLIVLSGCEITPRALKCDINGESIYLSSEGEATEFEGEPAVEFGPVEGETFFELTFENCIVEGLNGTYPIDGSITGAIYSWYHSLEFTNKSSDLYLGGSKVLLSGAMLMYTEAGELLKVAP